MAVYRHIHIDYWQDGFVLDLTPVSYTHLDVYKRQHIILGDIIF